MVNRKNRQPSNLVPRQYFWLYGVQFVLSLQANEDKGKDKVVVELEGRVSKLEGFLKAAKKKITQVINEKTQLETSLQEKIEEIKKLVSIL